MKIVIVGPAYPFRGGIATFDEMLARTFTAAGHDARIVTFTLQYPRILFPGKTQFSQAKPPAGLKITRRLNSVNPLNWLKVGREIARERPELVIMKYWTPFMGPALGTVARRVRRNGYTKVVVQLDNIVPHEHSVIDRPFNKYFINSADGFVYMSDQVGNDLKELDQTKPALFSPHPLFANFGEKVPREQALDKLGLDPSFRYGLFFGLVREYKGLDVLLEALALLKKRGLLPAMRLIVAGEFYENPAPYTDLIERLGIKNDIILHDRFIRDDLVKYYFSAADVLIQPYKTATQSGVTQIAYNFDLPMIVTRVGGLAEIVSDGVSGYVVDPDAESVADAVYKLYTGDNLIKLRESIPGEKSRFSWDAMMVAILRVFEITKEQMPGA